MVSKGQFVVSHLRLGFVRVINLDKCEINACFLLNEHGGPHFLFYKFNENNILNN